MTDTPTPQTGVAQDVPSGPRVPVSSVVANIRDYVLVLALLGTFSIDAKRRRKLGAAWDGFAARTSNLPFAALASGRAKLKWREILDWRLAVAVVLYLALLFGHQSLMGVSPFATG